MDLRPYQKGALERILGRGRMIYADAPGTGKTPTSLAWLHAAEVRRALIVAPLPVLHHWESLAGVWWPGAEVHVGHGSAKRRAAARERVFEAVGPSGLVVNYEAFRADHEHYLGRFDAAVFDEAHRLKNRRAQVRKAAGKVARRVNRLLLVTGTPLVNSADELWSSLNLLDHKAYPSYWRWTREHFRTEDIMPRGRVGRPVTLVGDLKYGHEALVREQIAGVLIQRPIEELLPDLPDVTETTVLVDLSPSERKAYTSMLERFWMVVDGEVVQASNTVSQMTRLRQLASDWSEMGGDTGSKVTSAAELVADLHPEQAVVICAYKASVRSLRAALDKRGITTVTYTGDDVQDRRDDAVKAFREGRAQVLVGTHGAVGEGVDGLQVARHIVMYDRAWTPAANEQAIARIRRSGQSATKVNVVYIEAKGTIDQYVAEVVEGKQSVFDALVGGFSKEDLCPT